MPPTSSHPQVTLIVVPRERFSCVQDSLESLYTYTQYPFNLTYVDGNSPPSVHAYLRAQAERRGFTLIRTEYYLTPNTARNLGLVQADTEYVVFIDNDVIVSPRWLTALVNCAETTGAAVVGPLMCQDRPLHQTVHFAGGEAHIWMDPQGRRRIREKMYGQGKTVAAIKPHLQRIPVELAEFHCVLVRRSIFKTIGSLDEGMFNTKEHLDFCMSVAAAGGSIYFEPDSIVTYVPGPPLQWSDLHYYMLRWSNGWTLESLQHFRAKWDLAEDAYFKSKYKKLGWRRYNTVIEPLARKLTAGVGSHLLSRGLAKVEHGLNRILTLRYRHSLKQDPPSPKESGIDPTHNTLYPQVEAAPGKISRK